MSRRRTGAWASSSSATIVSTLTAILYVRKVEIENLLPMPARRALFWHHDFNLWASSEGNTAYYAPNLQAMIHYKGKCWMLANVCVDGDPPRNTACTTTRSASHARMARRGRGATLKTACWR